MDKKMEQFWDVIMEGNFVMFAWSVGNAVTVGVVQETEGSYAIEKSGLASISSCARN